MAGSFVYVVTIELDGTVGPVWTRNREGNLSDEVIGCMSSVLRSATFPAPRGGHAAAVDVPVSLTQDATGGDGAPPER